MKNKKKMVALGSKTAKDGFKNETFVVSEFNGWKNSIYARNWLEAMNYNLSEIEHVNAEKVTGHFKADIQVQVKIEIKLKKIEDVQNLQIKLVSNPQGFNQIDKRWLKNYNELWDIPDNVYKLLQHFTGEVAPKINNPKDERRMFMNEFSKDEQNIILNYIKENKIMIISDILKGRGKFAAEWMLVILKNKELNTVQWALEPINKVLNYYGSGKVQISPRGSIKIGNITIQRKGGDGGRKTANMLQFKINPAEII